MLERQPTSGDAPNAAKKRQGRRIQVPTLETLPEDALIETISSSEFYDRPPDKMLRDVALSHCQNETSHLDYMQGSSAANVPLRRIGSKCDSAFCDTIVVFAIVAEYHTVPPGQRENTSSGVLDDVAALDFSGKLKMRRLKKSHAQVLRERVQIVFREAVGADAVPCSKDIMLQNGVQTFKESTLGEPFAADEGDRKETSEKHRVRLQSSHKQQEVERRLNINGAGKYADKCDDGMLHAVNIARSLEKQDRRELLQRLQDPANIKLVVPNSMPALEAADLKKSKPTAFYSQEIRVALPNQPLGAILNGFSSNAFSDHGLYLYAMDFTVDCAGAIRKWPSATKPPVGEPPALVPALLGTGAYQMQIEGRCVQAGAIVKNDQQVGRNCTTVLRTSTRIGHGGLMCRRRDKIYSKPINNFEKRTLRKRIGHHIQTTHNIMFDRVALGFDSTTDTGYSRAETTIYIERPFQQPWLNRLYVPRSVAEVNLELDEVVNSVPAACVMHTPHTQLYANWCKHIKHSLVVVDARYNRALVVMAVNSVTNCVASTEINGWSRKHRFALEHLTLGRAPIDILTIHRGRDYIKPVKANRCKRKAKARSTGARANKKRKTLSTTNTEVDSTGTSPESSMPTPAAVEPEEQELDDAGSEEVPEPAEEQLKGQYKPGMFQPEDKEGCIVVSQRFFRLPRAASQLSEASDFLPTTRFFSDNLGRGFHPGEYPYPDPADDDKPEADQKRPWPLPKGWNGDGSKISIVGERPERYSDESLATMTLKRSGMAANEYIAAENWPNLSHRKKPRYVEMASASSKLPINRCALVRKEASAELSSSVEDRAVSVQQSLFEASIERADLLAKRIREISVEGSVRRLKAGCQQNGSGHRSELIPAGCHEVVALEVVRTATSGERGSVKVHLRVPLEGATLLTDCNSTPKTKAYGTPSRFSDAVYSAVNQLKPLMYTAPKADGGNDFYLDTDDRAIGLLTAPACGGMIFCTLSITVNGETVQLLPLPTPSSDDAGADAEGGRSSASTEAGDSSPSIERMPIPALAYDPSQGRLFKDIPRVDGIKVGSLLHVVAAGRGTVSYNNAMIWPLHVRVDGESITWPVWGRAKLMQLKDQMGAGCGLIVKKITARDVEVIVYYEGEWWKRIAPYAVLPKLHLKMADPPVCTDIAATAHVANTRKDHDNLVVRMTDGKVYAFKAPQSVNKVSRTTLTLEAGFTLDTKTWSTTRTPTQTFPPLLPPIAE